MSTGFVLDALDQAIHARHSGNDLVHHSDQASLYLSIRYSERLAEADWRSQAEAAEEPVLN